MQTHEYLLQKYGTTLTFQQAQEEIGVYWQTIREMCLRGEIKTARAGRKWVLTTKALAEYLDNKSGAAQSSPAPLPAQRGQHRKIV